jgi:hypothetical protein
MGAKQAYLKGQGPGKMMKPIGASSPMMIRSAHKHGSQGKH